MKMNKYHPLKKKLILAIVSISAFSFSAQNTAPAAGQSFTLQQAIEYAIKNSPTVQNANTDYELAKAQKNQIRGIGLPQISASTEYRSFERTLFQSLGNNSPYVSYDQYKKEAKKLGENPLAENDFNKFYYGASDIKKGTETTEDYKSLDSEQKRVVDKAIASGGGAGALIQTSFGSPFTGTLGVSANQLLFSSDYIVALQTAKTYLEFSKQGVAVSEAQIKANVSKSYYMVLVSRERSKLLEANIVKVKKSKDELSAYNKQGFVEKIDVDRLEVTYNNLVTESEKVKKLIELGEASLKFNMNFDITQAISLTDSIVDVNNIQPLAYAKPDYSGRPEYNLAQKGLQLNALGVKREQYSVLPTVVAYAQNNWTNYNALNSKEYFNSNYWNRQFVIGGSISMPIFSGGQKYYATKVAKLKMEKTRQDIKNLENAINIETQSAVINFNNSILSMQSQKKNMELANEIFRVAQIKYTSGTGSNLEVLNAQTSLREAQINYTDALYSYYNAKIDYEKATGTLK
jgi:outer membrane protein